MVTVLRSQKVSVVTVVEQPEALVTLAEAKAHLRVEHDTDDEYIEALIDAVTASIDGPRGSLGRALKPQTLQLAAYDCDALVYDLPYPPIIEIESVVYDDADGTEVEIEASAYLLTRSAISFLSSLPTYNELRVRYRAGFAGVGEESPFAEPKELKQARAAILLMISDLYRNREASTAPALVTNPAVARLLEPLRIFAIA